MNYLEELKLILRETDCPFFTDEELEYYYTQNKKNVNLTAYRCLVIKAENTTLQLSGLSCADTSAYFLRLSQRYAPNHSGVLKGSW